MKKLLVVFCSALLLFLHTGVIAKAISDKKEGQPITLKLLWSTSAKRLYFSELSSSMEGHTLMTVNKKGQLRAIHRSTGKLLWQKKHSMLANTWPTVDEGKMYFGTQDSALVACDRQGNTLWKREMTGELLRAPVIHHDTIYVQSLDGALTAVDKMHGKIKWHYAALRPLVSLHYINHPVVSDQHIIAGLSNGKMVVLDMHDGSVLWEKESSTPQGTSNVEKMLDIHIDPMIMKDKIAVANYQGVLNVLHKTDGNVIWEKTLPGMTGMTHDTKTVYVTTTFGELHAFDIETGKQEWQKKISNTELSSPLMSQQKLFVGDAKGTLYAVDTKSGSIQFHSKIKKDRAIQVAMITDKILCLFVADSLNAYSLPL